MEDNDIEIKSIVDLKGERPVFPEGSTPLLTVYLNAEGDPSLDIAGDLSEDGLHKVLEMVTQVVKVHLEMLSQGDTMLKPGKES